MAFHFVLQPVLRLRQSLEDRERLRLALVLSCLAKLDQACRQLDLQQNQIAKAVRDRLQSGMAAAELHFEQARVSALQRNKSTLLLQRAALEKEKVAQERALAEAQRKRKTVENMRERQFDLYRQAQQRIDQQRVDELYSARRTNRS
jgi:flagellar export protein FliJ